MWIWPLIPSSNSPSVVISQHSLPLVAVSPGHSLVLVFGLLITVASLVAEHRLQGTWAQ